MLDGLRHDYRTMPLDPDLLSTPFRVQTNWHVITGAPCSGKTTIIDQLADQVFRTVSETAREYFEMEMAKGRSLDEIRAEGEALQKGIAALQLRTERGLKPEETAFLDWAIPDSITFHRILGMNPHEIVPLCFQNRYASVFILDRIPNLRDATLGPEDEASARYLDSRLERDYSALGYRVVRVSVSPPKERLAFILERLPEGGLAG